MVPESDREIKSLLDFDDQSAVKTLCIQWSSPEDSFKFKISLDSRIDLTKRSVLSNIAKIFDPLGWVSPCVVTAKFLIQDLWAERKGWDEPLSVNQENIWKQLREGFVNVSAL